MGENTGERDGERERREKGERKERERREKGERKTRRDKDGKKERTMLVGPTTLEAPCKHIHTYTPTYLHAYAPTHKHAYTHTRIFHLRPSLSAWWTGISNGP